jgi:5-methylcytosine-specific restriction endonuclease McrA
MNGMVVVREYTPEEWRALLNIDRWAKFAYIDGFEVPKASLRMRLFLSAKPGRGLICARCGRKATRILLQRPAKPHWCYPPQRAWFYPYSDDAVMLTRDHIVPKALGGKNISTNMQTLCLPCNASKADRT